MKIGVELAGTVLDVLKSAEKWFGELQQKEASTFDELYPLISDDNLQSWRSSKRTYEKMPAVDDSLRAMDILSQSHELCGITSIDGHLINTVANWLLAHSVAVSNVSHTKNKDIRARLEKVDVFIESDAESARELSKFCRVIILDSPYNRFGAGNNVERAHSWEEILEMLDGKDARYRNA